MKKDNPQFNFKDLLNLKSAILIFILFLMQAIVADVALASSKTFYILTANPTSDNDLQFLASHYSLIDDDGADLTAEQIDRLHSLNPTIKIIKYINGSNIYVKGSDYTWIDLNHPDWFLLDSSGNRVFTRLNNAGLKPGNPEVQDWFAEKCSEILTNKPYDGIFTDVIGASPKYIYYDLMSKQMIIPVNPDTGSQYTYLEWQAHQQQKLDAIKAKIGSKLLIYNGLSYNCYFDNDAGEGYRFWNGNSDGAMIEGFMRWSSDPISSFRSESNWQKDVDMIADSVSKGRVIIASTAFNSNADISAEEKENISMYSYASFLLGADSNLAYFSVRDVSNGYPTESTFNDVWLFNLGEPTGSYYKQDNVYQRDFSNGLVLVNPSPSEIYTINLTKSYRTLDGQTVSQVTLNPHRGLLLSADNSVPDSSISNNIPISSTTNELLVNDSTETVSNNINLTKSQRAGRKKMTMKYAASRDSVFKDISETDWAQPYIEELAQRGIIDGFANGSFMPTRSITRAEFVKLLVLTMGWNVTNHKNSSFHGVSKDHWAIAYIETAKMHGAINGYKNGNFRPENYISRAEVAKAIVASKGYRSASTDYSYPDIACCWARDSIQKCIEKGIISGYPKGKYMPQMNASRAEVAKIMAMILK